MTTLCQVFAAEVEAGLAEQVAQGRIHLVGSCQLPAWAEGKASPLAPPPRALSLAAAAAGQPSDLLYLEDILVSSGWNLNDEVFLPGELWSARATPIHKPLNYEHVQTEVVGHTLTAVPVRADLSVIPEDTDPSSLPDEMHILTSDVLYRHWNDIGMKLRFATVVAEMAQGKWFVSMECLLPHFDYALKGATGNTQLVARNDQTSFLTKHLRAYGGDGTFEGYRIGRVPRNFAFSGKGLVKNPGNPKSTILGLSPEPFPARAALLDHFPTNHDDAVYSISSQADPSGVATEEKQMEEQLKTLEAQLTAKTTELATLEAARATAESRAAALETELTSTREALVASQAQVKALTDAEVAGKARITELETVVASLTAEKREAERARLVASKLGYDAERALAFVKPLAALSDEQLAEHVEALASVLKPAAPVAPAPAPAPETLPEQDAAGEATVAAVTEAVAAAAPETPALVTPAVTEPDSRAKLKSDVLAFLQKNRA